MKHKLKEKKLRTLGPKTKNVWGTEVDLTALGKHNIRYQEGATFSHFEFYDVRKLGDDYKNNPNFWNLGIRADQNNPDDLEYMKTQFYLNGFDMTHPLPCLGTDGVFRDGRSRITITKDSDNYWFPVAVYDYSDEDNLQQRANGVVSNYHAPQRKAVSKDIEECVADALIQGDLEVSRQSILDYLHNELAISKFTSDKGTVTRIVNNSLSKYNANQKLGTTLVRIQSDRKQWIDWLENNGYGKNKKDFYLYCVDNETYSSRCYADMLLRGKFDDPFPIILYTNQTNPQHAIDKVLEFQQRLAEINKNAYQMCRSIPHDEDAHWEFLGAIPQIHNFHDTESSHLVPLEDYGKKSKKL